MVTKKAKVIDKWKTKSWYTAIAPEMFENKPVGELVASDAESLINRVIFVSFPQISTSTSYTSQYMMLKFRVTDVKGNTAYTKFIGYEVSPSYIKTIIRRRRTLIDTVVDVTTKERLKLRMKVVAVLGAKVSENTRKNVLMGITEKLHAFAAASDSSKFIQEVLYGKISTKLFGQIKKISPIKRIEIRKMEITEKFT